jgi:hypothetical protein
MGRYVLVPWIIGILLVWGCSPVQPLFIDSNQVFIEQTVNQIDLGKVLKGTLPQGSKVALMSMETQITLDKPIIVLIEDQLIQSLVAERFVPLERDENLVVNLLEEGHNDKYSIVQKNYSYQDSLQKTPLTVFKTKLNAAPYIISYRILECGLIYRDVTGSESQKKVGREGIVKLHVRVQNTQTGEIIYANNLIGEKKDQILKELVNPLANFHYTFYPHEYPLQK